MPPKGLSVPSLTEIPSASPICSRSNESWRTRASIPDVSASATPSKMNSAPMKVARSRIVQSMPKMRTHSGAKKRFRKTATGKLRGRRAYSSHILEKKSQKRKRNMRKPVEISTQDSKEVRTLLAGKGRKK